MVTLVKGGSAKYILEYKLDLGDVGSGEEFRQQLA